MSQRDLSALPAFLYFSMTEAKLYSLSERALTRKFSGCFHSSVTKYLLGTIRPWYHSLQLTFRETIERLQRIILSLFHRVQRQPDIVSDVPI